MDADFCVEALKEALAKHGKPEIFNTDQGSQFTVTAPLIPQLMQLDCSRLRLVPSSAVAIHPAC
jgi:hypothetical protein